MRYGKTKIAIDFCEAMHILEDVRRVLVVTPPDGVYVWENEIAKHGHPASMCTLGPVPLDGLEPLVENAVWFHVIHWQDVFARERTGRGNEWVPIDREDLWEFDADVIVADESHHAGNPTAITSRVLYRLCRRAPTVLLMTGTMFHRKPFYVFGQVKLYDASIFGTDWGHFKKRIAIFGGFGNYEVKRYRRLGWMMKKIRPWTWIEKKVPTAPPAINVIPAPLTGRNKQVYDKMERESIVRVGDATGTADIVLTRHLRLQQICGGWLHTDKGYRRVGSCKLKMAESRLREYMAQDIEKAVIGVRFIRELVDLAKLAKKIGYLPILFHGRLPKGRKRYARIERFQTIDRPALFITQIRAAREAIDLSVASTMMLYSLDESYLTYDQFTSRIEVYGDKRTLQYDHLVCPGTRDEVSWEAMKEKRDVADFIADDPDRVERIVQANAERRERQ